MDWETVGLYAVGIIVLLLGLGVSIALHEFGHLIPAKLFGVYVSKYMIGFGPRLWSRKRGETEYGFRLLPLGGYITMAGMYPPAVDGERMRDSSTSFLDAAIQEAGPQEDESRAFYRLAIWKRIIIMLGGPFMNLVLAVVCYAIVLCLIGVPQISTTLASISACVQPASSTETSCAASDPRSPAVLAGLQAGDRLISIGGQPATDWNSASELIRDDAGEAVPFVVERSGQQLTLTVTPTLTQRYAVDAEGNTIDDANGDPTYVSAGFVGISPAYENVPQPITAVLPSVGRNIAQVGQIIVTLQVRVWNVGAAIFDQQVQRDPNGPLSIVGVGRIAGEAASMDTVPILDRIGTMVGLVASLNVALLVFNLIPLLPLDGGHVLAAVIDGVRRGWAWVRKKKWPKPIDISRLAPLTLAVVGILGVMSLVLIVGDIVKPITIG